MRFTRSQLILVPLLFLLDCLSVVLALYAAYHIRFFSAFVHSFPITKGLPGWGAYLNTLPLILPLCAFVFFQHGLYRTYFLPFIDEVIRSTRSVTVGIFFLLMATFFYRDYTYSRLTIVIFWFLSIVFVTGYRQLFKFSLSYIFRLFSMREHVLVVGRDNRMIRRLLKRFPYFQVFYAPSDDEKDINKIKKICVERSINQIIIAHQKWTRDPLLAFYDWCETRHIELKSVPDIVQICQGEIKIDSSLGIPFFHYKPVSFNGFNFYFKRIVDIVISILVVSILWPIFLLVIIFIKIDSPGPFLYDHKRMGYRGQVFSFFKFRTMVVNADALLEQFKAKSNRKGPVFKMVNDPRVTRIGNLLRRYSIDELLQVFNVLKGEMSLVGPRPQVLWEAAAYDNWAKRRLRVLPGITGLWQVSGRANLSYEEMIELDIYYIENWSPGLDIVILLKTLPAIFSQRGAY